MTGNSQRTLVILTPAFPQDESDSVWVPSKQLFVKKLRENFPTLHIIVLSFNYPHHTETYRWHGVNVISFNGMRTRKFQRLQLWMRVWKQLSIIRKKHTIIGLFSFWCGECALVGRYFAKRYHLKHFCWISGMDAKKENRLVKLIRPAANELVAMSAFLVKEFHKNHSIQPQHLIPIGIDPSAFLKSTAVRDIDIVGVGSLSPFKQYDVFIQVVKKLSHSFPGIKTVICGGGEEQYKLEKLIVELQLENNIVLLGKKSHAEVLQWMQRARILLHPSLYEGFGAVFLEALYAGAHVVSFCDPMQLQIKRWHIVQNTEEMKNILLELLNKPQAEHNPVLLYTMDDTAKAIMQLFDTH